MLMLDKVETRKKTLSGTNSGITYDKSINLPRQKRFMYLTIWLQNIQH